MTATLIPILPTVASTADARLDDLLLTTTGVALTRADIDQLVTIARDRRSAIPRTLWAARVLVPSFRPPDWARETATAALDAVGRHDRLAALEKIRPPLTHR